MSETREGRIGIPVPYYYGPREVNERPRPIETIDLEGALARGPAHAGTLILVLWINENGRVDRVSVESSQLPESVRRLVIKRFGSVTFSPAQLDGKAVKSRMTIEIFVQTSSAYTIPPPGTPRSTSAMEN